jgi:hypothetical protein
MVKHSMLLMCCGVVLLLFGIMCKRLICLTIVLVLAFVSSASAWVYWNNNTGDRLWSTAGNWSTSSVPTSSDDVWLQSTLATVGPTIDSSTAAICGKMLGPGSRAGSTMTMNINGGSLTTTTAGGYWSIGQDTVAGIANVTGGSVSVNGTLYVGNQSSGTLNVSGGSNINATSNLRIANSNGATDIGHINLGLGTLSCEDIFGTAGKTLINITEGTLIIRNKSGGSIEDWVTAGWIVGYNGSGTVIVEDTPEGWDKLTAIPGSEFIIKNRRFYDPVNEKYVACRGVVYMQPEAMHHHFWSNVEVQRLDADFQLFKERGFDTIVLKPAWGDFIPDIWYFDTPNVESRVDQNMPDLLEQVVDTAADHGLYVLMMPGAITVPDFYSDAGQTSVTRILTGNY